MGTRSKKRMHPVFILIGTSQEQTPHCKLRGKVNIMSDLQIISDVCWEVVLAVCCCASSNLAFVTIPRGRLGEEKIVPMRKQRF